MKVLERFLDLVSFDTQSSEHSETVPSTPGQKVLGAHLADAMQRMGLTDVSMDKNGYVMGYLPATEGQETAPVLGFISHMDTSPDASARISSPG